MSNIIVTGSGSGLGCMIAVTLAHAGHSVMGFTLDPKPHGVYGELDVDVSNKVAVRAAARQVFPGNYVDCVIYCAGINRIGMLEDYETSDWDDVLDTNAKSMFLMAKYFLPRLSKWPGGEIPTDGGVHTCKRYGGTILNIVSNASHMPMTGSAAYNASKGAAHILTLQLARELTRRHGITVFGISPNKLAGTGMSEDIDRQVCETRGWTPEYAKQYQLNNLLAGEETDPQQLAEFITYLLDSKDRHKYLTGCIIPYGA